MSQRAYIVTLNEDETVPAEVTIEALTDLVGDQFEIIRIIPYRAQEELLTGAQNLGLLKPAPPNDLGPTGL